MTDIWEPNETTTHQDHVIAHVIGATVLGYFVFAEVLYILLDIGFLWGIFLDGQMTLLPHPVAISELEIDEQVREGVKTDIGVLLSDNPAPDKLLQMKPSPVFCQINDVSFFSRGDQRRLALTGEESNLAIVTSLDTAEIEIYEF
ncbi:MAG: hypothetical protein M3R52_09825 [Acidobacteriota bacterium]|nr:hypothetical protein [Acidobacteriota bacterium]